MFSGIGGFEKGILDVYGQPLVSLDANWQETVLGANMLGAALRKAAPYLLILAIFLAYPLAQLFGAQKVDA